MGLPNGLTALLGGLGGAASGLFPSKTSSGTSQTTTDYSPQQAGLQGNILSDLTSALSGGPGGAGIQSAFAPIAAAGTSSIDQGYTGLIKQMNQQLASRGFAASGTTGLNMEKLDSQRMGDIGTFQGNLAGQEVGEYNSLLGDALKAAYTPAGSQTATNNKSGTSVGYGAVTGLLSGLAGMSGGGGGGSSPAPPTGDPGISSGG